MCGGFWIITFLPTSIFGREGGDATSEVGRWLIATKLDGIAFQGGLAKIQIFYSGIKFSICLQILVYSGFWIITFLHTSIFGEDGGDVASEVGRRLIAIKLDGIAFQGGLAKIQMICSGIKIFICLQILAYRGFWIITFLPTTIFGRMGVMPPLK